MTEWVFKGELDGSTYHLDVYDSIGGFGGLSAIDVRRQLLDASEVETIQVRINSPGGDVFDGMAIYSLLKDHPARVIASVDGLAASMASIILMAADESSISPGGFVMIHNPHTVVAGGAKRLVEMSELLGKMAGALGRIYAEKTGIEYDDIVAMMDAETWLDAEEAVAKGFVDSVQGQESLTALANVDIARFSGVPAALSVAQAKALLVSQVEESADDTVGQIEESVMDLRELKAQHPDVYEAAVAEGIAQERDRVGGHLAMAEQTGAIDIAYPAIRDGAGMSQTIVAQYLAKGMDRADQRRAQADRDEAALVVDAADTSEPEDASVLAFAVSSFLGADNA